METIREDRTKSQYKTTRDVYFVQRPVLLIFPGRKNSVDPSWLYVSSPLMNNGSRSSQS